MKRITVIIFHLPFCSPALSLRWSHWQLLNVNVTLKESSVVTERNGIRGAAAERLPIRWFDSEFICCVRWNNVHSQYEPVAHMFYMMSQTSGCDMSVGR